MSSNAQTWRTAIAEVRKDDVLVRGHLLSDLLGKVTFTEMIYLDIVGRMPTTEELRVLDTILVSLVEHGISPSSVISRMLASCGTPSQAAIAGGALSIADWHGGAGQQAGALLARLAGVLGPTPTDEEVASEVSTVVDTYLRSGQRFEGFGHPQHPEGDPRAMALFDVAAREGTSGLHCRLMRSLGEEISRRRGRPLPVNVNGAIAAVLLDLGFAEVTVRGLVIGARVFGLTAHVAEELDQGGRWRHVDADAVEYTGPVPD